MRRASVPARVQSRRLRPGEAGVLPGRAPDHRPRARGSGSDEAAPNPDRVRRISFAADRTEEGSLDVRSGHWRNAARGSASALPMCGCMKERTMGFRDLIPWSKNQELAPSRDGFDPFLTLHREMNRQFDDVFRGFDGN